MATPAPTIPDPTSGNVGAQLSQIVAGLTAAGGAASGKFTWTPPKSTQGFDPTTTGVGRRLAAGGLLAPGQMFPSVQPLPDTIDAGTFGQRIAALDPSQVEALQRQLYESGAYPASYYGKNAKPVPWGQRDPDTVQILQQMAGLATFTGNLDQILGAKVDIGALSKTQRAPLVIELPAKDDLEHVLRQSAMELLGRDPTPDEMARYSSRFTEATSAYQKQRYAAEEGGGTVTQAPSATTAAESYLREQSPVEYGAQRIEKGLSSLRKLFTGGGGGG